ncbi:MAG: sulfurtransferase [Gammaproteobacteria bacterium]|nr:sulfurtransferase [Gammaproteobacteria bacterium]
MTHYTTLADASTLAGHLDDREWRIIDCRFELGKPHAGREAWKQGHIPGAVYADLERDLSGRHEPGDGRHPLPSTESIEVLCNALGVSNDSQVVAYDDTGGAFAARLWWLLRRVGHSAVAVLDGGWSAWVDAGMPVADTPVAPPPGAFIAHEPLVKTISAEEILADLPHENLRLYDARGASRFSGEEEPIDPVAGHIPGAENRPFTGNLDQEGRFLPAARLRERFSSNSPVVHYCGSGVTACHNLLAMEVAGLDAGYLYPGSWSGWIEDDTHPVERNGD